MCAGDKLSILKESQHYIQGVAWASHGGCLATLGTDRTLRIYNDKLKCIHSITKWSMSDEVGVVIDGCGQWWLWSVLILYSIG